MKGPLSYYCAATAAACILSVAGCGAREAFDQIELGKPLPRGNLLLAQTDKPIRHGRVAWSDGAWPLPMVLAADLVAVLVDDAGHATAKSYAAFAFGHWGLFMGMSTRTVLEVVVPPESFREAAPGWKLPPHHQRPRDPSNVIEFLDDLPLPTCAHVSHVLLWLEVCPLLAEPMYMLGMRHLSAEVTSELLAEAPACLAGVTREGFDWTYTNPHGGTIRIRNLGQRRLRVETSGLTLCDPFALTLQAAPPIDYPAHFRQAVQARSRP